MGTTRAHGDQTKRQVLEFIIRFKAENDGNSPTYREIIEACHLSSTGHIDYILKGLEDRGQIVLGPGNRNIQIPGGVWLSPDKVKVYRDNVRNE